MGGQDKKEKKKNKQEKKTPPFKKLKFDYSKRSYSILQV